VDKAEKIRDAMMSMDVDALVMVGVPSKDANIYYSTEFLSHDTVFYLCTHSSEKLAVPNMELKRAMEESRVEDVVSFSKPSSVLSELVKGLKEVCIPREFPVYLADKLRNEVNVKVVKNPILASRECKGDKEIVMMKETTKITEEAISRAIDMIHKSKPTDDGLVFEGTILTSELVRTEIETYLLKKGCFADGTIVAGGRISSIPHCTGRGRLLPDEPIIIDVFPMNKNNRYYSDITRSVVKLWRGGKKVERIVSMYNAVLDAQHTALSLVKEGVKCEEVYECVKRKLIEMGFDAPEKGSEGFIHSAGHGVGLEVHESPFIGKNKGILKDGMVITIEPGLYYHDVGGVRVEDVVVVEENGYEQLSTLSTPFLL